VVTYLSIIGRLVKVLRGLGVPALFVGRDRGGWVSRWSAVVAVWSFYVVTGGRRRCTVVE
jgi:hypothetical protein